jgi:glycosyltransferase involved in cell wall biosynthesis
MNYSIAIITRNEEHTLPLLLKSISNFIDAGGEVVILDTGSTDNTVDVAKELGCKVYQDSFDGFIETEHLESVIWPESVKTGDRYFDFSAARNVAASLCTNDWIQVMAADEVFVDYNPTIIENIITKGSASAVSNLHYYSVTQDGKLSTPQQVTYIYNKKVHYFKNVVHEVLYPINKNEPYVIETANNIVSVHHKNMDTDRSHYLVGLIEGVYREPSPRNLFYLGRELMYNHDYENACIILNEAVIGNQYTHEASQALIFKGNCMEKLGDTEGAVLSWVNAVAIDTQRRDPAMTLANFYYLLGDAPRSAFWASAALTIPNDGTKDVRLFPEYYSSYPHKILYWALYHMGDIQSARKHFEKAIELDPEDVQLQKEKEFFI